MKTFETVIFDLGGVLIDWNPRYLYRKIFKTEGEIESFLETICTPEWNEKEDAGRPFEEAVQELIPRFPQHEMAIRAWHDRFEETLGGSISGTVEILAAIRDQKSHRLLALTNWSAETFPVAKRNFDFLQWFEGIVVSGEEKTLKPRPEFYRILLSRYGINPSTALFIDDNVKNVEGAEAVGIRGILFKNPAQLKAALTEREILRLKD